MADADNQNRRKQRGIFIVLAVLPIPFYWLVSVWCPMQVYGFFTMGGWSHLVSTVAIALCLGGLLLSRRAPLRSIGYGLAFMTAISPVHYSLYITGGMLAEVPTVTPLQGFTLISALVLLALTTCVSTKVLVQRDPAF